MRGDLRDAIAGDMARTRADLERLVRIPSIAFPGYDTAPVRSSAEATADILASAGYDGVRLIEMPDVEHPAVYGEVRGPADRKSTRLNSSHT